MATDERLGTQAAIFVPSGTMSNKLAVRCQSEHGDAIMIDKNTQHFGCESGAPAALSKVTCNLNQQLRVKNLFKN